MPGSVKVIGRKLIESYAGVFHTVDHVEGTLAEGFDSLDAFLSHMWAVTIIGAPKKWAAQAIENLEKDAARLVWRSGRHDLDGWRYQHRHHHPHRSSARWRGSHTAPARRCSMIPIPASEDRECAMKATGFFRALNAEKRRHLSMRRAPKKARGVRLLLVDNEDCFIHTLSNYARQTGAEVITYRSGFPLELIENCSRRLILVSPGPGRPADFGVPELVRHAAKLEIPVSACALACKAWWKRSAAN